MSDDGAPRTPSPPHRAPLAPLQAAAPRPRPTPAAASPPPGCLALLERVRSFAACVAGSPLLQSALLAVEASGDHPPPSAVSAPGSLDCTLAQMLALFLRSGANSGACEEGARGPGGPCCCGCCRMQAPCTPDPHLAPLCHAAEEGALLAALWVLQSVQDSDRGPATVALNRYLAPLSAVCLGTAERLAACDWGAAFATLRAALVRAQLTLLGRLAWRVCLDGDADVAPCRRLLFDADAWPAGEDTVPTGIRFLCTRLMQQVRRCSGWGRVAGCRSCPALPTASRARPLPRCAAHTSLRAATPGGPAEAPLCALPPRTVALALADVPAGPSPKLGLLPHVHCSCTTLRPLSTLPALPTTRPYCVPHCLATHLCTPHAFAPTLCLKRPALLHLQFCLPFAPAPFWYPSRVPPPRPQRPPPACRLACVPPGAGPPVRAAPPPPRAPCRHCPHARLL